MVNKRIAITPIQLDLTAKRLLDRLNRWSWNFPEVAPAAPAAAEPITLTGERQDETVVAQAEPEDERR